MQKELARIIDLMELRYTHICRTNDDQWQRKRQVLRCQEDVVGVVRHLERLAATERAVSELPVQ